jgi:serine phosphatase RsbU (regulator of sigma subunit)
VFVRRNEGRKRNGGGATPRARGARAGARAAADHLTPEDDDALLDVASGEGEDEGDGAASGSSESGRTRRAGRGRSSRVGARGRGRRGSSSGSGRQKKTGRRAGAASGGEASGSGRLRRVGPVSPMTSSHSGERTARGDRAGKKRGSRRRIPRIGTDKQAAVGREAGRGGRTPARGSQRLSRASMRRQAVEDEIAPFRRGISLGIKFAAFSAVLVAALMSVLGIYLYGVAAERIDHLINQNGVVAAKELATFLDPFFVYSDDMQERLERTDEWNSKLSALVADAAHEFLHIRITPDSQGFQAPYLASSQDAPRVSLRGLPALGEVSVREGTYSGAGFQGRIRVFSAPVRALPPDSTDETGEDAGDGAAPDAQEPSLIAYAHVFVKAGQIDEAKDETYSQVAVATAVGIGLAMLLSFGLSMLLVRPLKQLVRDIDVVAVGNLDHKTVPRSSDEIGQVAHQFDEMTRSLRKARKLEQERQAIENELAIATEIQTKLLPERIPQIPGYDLFSFYLSAREVGGDYYDFLVIDQTHLGLVVADVSGKGIPGAMVMTMVRSLLRLASHREISPAETLKKVNRILARDIRPGMFVTALYAVLDVHSRKLTVSSAGHSPMLHFAAATGTVRQVNPSGMALGFDKGRTFDDTIAEEVVTLAPGDRILTYTDGVMEAMDEENAEFGLEQLEGLVTELGELSSKDFTDTLVARLEEHRGGAEQSDDITITTLRVE